MANQAAEKTEDDKANSGEQNKASESEKPTLEVVERPSPVLIHRMQLADEINTRWHAYVPPGVTPDQCMDEAFWSHVGTRLTMGDTLVVRPDTMEWELVLHVAGCGREYAHVVKKHYYDLKHDATNKPEPSRYSTDFAGGVHKFRFLRDGVVMKDGFASKDLAERAAKNHQMAVDRSK